MVSSFLALPPGEREEREHDGNDCGNDGLVLNNEVDDSRKADHQEHHRARAEPEEQACHDCAWVRGSAR